MKSKTHVTKKLSAPICSLKTHTHFSYKNKPNFSLPSYNKNELYHYLHLYAYLLQTLLSMLHWRKLSYL